MSVINTFEQEVAVSVLCTAYNHEEYIRRCLDGFVMQKTSFRFEVIVHDDASTDNTADIIREYVEKFPDIIKPIYQTENKYSQEIDIYKEFLYPAVRGRYVAVCEGDDYWTDPLKLQKQFDFSESHPDYSACYHQAVRHYCDGSGTDYVFPDIASPRDYSVDEVIRGIGSLLATNSMFCRTECAITIPDCFYAKDFGDYQAAIYAAICGRLHCMSDVMSVYNYGTAGSWTTRITRNPSKRLAHYKGKIKMLRNVDSYYAKRYHSSIQAVINTCRSAINTCRSAILTYRFPHIYPTVYNLYRRIKDRLNEK